MTGRGTHRYQQIGTLASLCRNGAIGNVEPRPHFPDPSLVDDVAGVGNVAGRVVSVDKVRADMDHIFLVYIFDDIGFREDDLPLHTTGRTDVEIVGPIVVVSPLVFAEPLRCHLVANVFGHPRICFQKPEYAVGIVPVLLVNCFPLFETGLSP